MVLISENITKVRAFELTCGIWENGKSFNTPKVALVKWYSDWQDKFHQIYVNGKFAGATYSCQQRQRIVNLPSSLEVPLRIEVFAVEPKNVFTDFSCELDDSDYKQGRVKITLLRSQSLPIGSVANVYFDNGSGTIDYDKAINDFPIWIWPGWQDKAGFGMSRFGYSGFGYDGAAAIGFGKGSFGYGQFGFDEDPIEWISKTLPAGTYKFAVKVTDQFGNQSSASQTGEVTVIPLARPAEGFEVSSYDKSVNQLVLDIS